MSKIIDSKNKSLKIRQMLEDKPHFLIRYGAVIILICLVLIFLCLCLFPFPGGEGESVLEHLISF